jgi:Spy/CpxP family protein refolding chaperone
VNTGKKWFVLSAIVLMTGSILIAADPTTKPSTDHHRSGLVKPWSDLTTLTDVQKAQIEKIHQASSEAQRTIRDKERTDIEALLTADQKAEMKTNEGEMTAERKERAAQKKTEETEAMPTTAPMP